MFDVREGDAAYFANRAAADELEAERARMNGRAREAAAGLHFRGADELRAEVPPEPDWVWAGYVAPGAVTLNAGKPKSGKSTLAYALAEAVALGARTFLGRAIKAGPVVYVSEEGAGTLAHKLPATDRVRVLTRDAAWPKPSWPELLAAAVGESERVGAVLLVVDALSFWAQLAPGDENDAAATQAVVDALGLATRAGLAVLLVHHQRKGGGGDGDAVRGSGAIFGAVDALIELERLGEDAPRNQRQLVASTRWPSTPPVLVVDRDSATGAWRPVGEAEDRSATVALGWRERLLGALPEEGAGATYDELAELLGADKRKWLPTLTKLHGEGLVRRSGEGKPHRPYRHAKVRPESPSRPRDGLHVDQVRPSLSKDGLDSTSIPTVSPSMRDGLSAEAPSNTPSLLAVEIAGCATHPDGPVKGCRYCRSKVIAA